MWRLHPSSGGDSHDLIIPPLPLPLPGLFGHAPLGAMCGGAHPAALSRMPAGDPRAAPHLLYGAPHWGAQPGFAPACNPYGPGYMPALERLAGPYGEAADGCFAARAPLQHHAPLHVGAGPGGHAAPHPSPHGDDGVQPNAPPDPSQLKSTWAGGGAGDAAQEPSQLLLHLSKAGRSRDSAKPEPTTKPSEAYDLLSMLDTS